MKPSQAENNRSRQGCPEQGPAPSPPQLPALSPLHLPDRIRCYRSRFRFSTPTRWRTYGTGPREDRKHLPPQQPEPMRIRSPSPLLDQLARSISVERKNGRNKGRTRRRASPAARKKRESHPSPSAQTRKSTMAPKLPRIRANRKLPLTKSTDRLPGRR